MSWVVKDFSELTAGEIYEILKSRAEVFQKEQGIHYVDPDDVDYESLHVFRIEMGNRCLIQDTYGASDKSFRRKSFAEVMK